jgi:NitT/TauT family transport system substrate-binding protein
MHSRSSSALIAVALAATALAGCGSSGSSTSSGGKSGSVTTIKIGTGSVADFGQYFVALKEGYFTQQKLKVQAVPVTNGPEAIAALKGGSIDATYAATLPLFLADEQGVGLQYVGPGDVESAGHWQYYMAVKSSSSITTLQQALAKGNKIGWIGASTPNAIALRMLMKQMHISASNVSFVTLAVPDITTALTAGEVNAAIPLEPFTATALQSKAIRTVGKPLDTIMGSTVPTGGYITTSSWAQSNASTLAAFDRALSEATAFIDNHPVEATSIIGTALKLSPAVAKAVPSLDFVSKLPVADVQTEIKEAVSVGLMSKTLSANSLFSS